MAVNVKIEQARIIKKKIDIYEIIKNKELMYGISEENYILEPLKTGANTIVYQKERIARGIDIWQEDYDICLSLSLPTTEEEIELFYELIEAFCKKQRTKKFFKDEEYVHIKNKQELIEMDKETSRKALVEIKERIKKSKTRKFQIFGALNPISIGSKEIEQINDNLTNLGNLLNELQQTEAKYIAPKLYKKKNDNLYGIYYISPNVTSIVPTKAYSLLNPSEEVKEWFVHLEGLDMIPFDDFIKNVQKIQDYDTDHIIIKLTEEECKELNEKYKIEFAKNE
ncbi:MAG: hypothetical protein K2M17_04420 [Bacilli bacterium]|nr:hypothetical protein [Bacilli bacterium]